MHISQLRIYKHKYQQTYKNIQNEKPTKAEWNVLNHPTLRLPTQADAIFTSYSALAAVEFQ